MAMLSSPLAAMQPPPPRWPSDARPPIPSFNFGELGTKRQSSEYLGVKGGSVRGSSPSASLAADLSQNFYIDQSPQVATPRRCLFQPNSHVLGNLPQQEGSITPIRWEGVTTPPILSSSPALAIENMDVSPLPHKPPFSLAGKLSRTNTSSSLTSHPNNVDSSLTLEEPLQKRRPQFRRPTLNRQRFQSTSILPSASQLPPFSFGAGGNGSANSSSMSLEDCFKDSPQRSTMFAGQTVGPVRPKIQFNGFNGRSNPVGALPGSRQCDDSQRPRKQFRRTLSMFEHPADIIKNEQKTTSSLDVIMDMDIDQTYQMTLPNFVPEDKPDSLPRISQETMISVLEGNYKTSFDQTMVIDCRFEYEFNGGHIDGAVNYNDKEGLAKFLFENPLSNKSLLILHCEYSAHRAPLMAQYIRQQDRSYNAAQYPKLTYPEVYILDGGYSSFFKNHRSRCFPQNYVEMDAKEHEQACERGLNKMRQRSKLSRAKTFAFGQRMTQIQESPSRADSSRAFGPVSSSVAILRPIPATIQEQSQHHDDTDLLFNSNRLPSRRTASY